MNTSEKIIEESVELWELVGDRWRLPILVRWEEGYAIVKLAPIPLLAAQKVVAAVELSAFPVNEGEHVLTPEQLRHVARKSQFGNAEDVVEWRRTVAPAAHFKSNPLIDEMLDAYCAKGTVQSRATMSAIYSTLCAHMLDWMINKKKPLDLWFCKLYPLQLRRNWKEVLLGKMCARGKGFEFSHSATEVRADLIDMSLIGLDAKSVNADWTIDVVPARAWTFYARRLEKRRREKFSINYWLAVEAYLKQQVPYAIECFRNYCSEVRAKVMAVPRCRRDRLGHFPKFKARPGPYAYVVPHVLPEEKEPRPAGTVDAPDADVPAMPGVQQETNDVRNSGRDIQK